MAGEWHQTTLGAIATRDGYGLVDGPFGSNLPASLYTHIGVPVIRGSNLTLGTGRFCAEEFVFVSTDTAKRLERSLCRPFDIVFTKKGTLGQTGLVPEGGYDRYLLSSNQMKLTVDREVADPLFVYYFVSSPGCILKIIRDSEATGVPKTNVAYLRDFPISLPPLAQQRAIAHILGTLDDKIELNRRMSETLEAMARALFKSWFVDFDPVRAKMEGRWQRGQSLPGLPAHLYDLFPDRLVDSELGEIPEGWKIGPLGQFFEIGLGGAWGEDQPSVRTTVSMHCLRGIDCHDLAEGRIPDVPLRWVTPKQAADRELPEGAILIEGSGSFCGRSVIWDRGYERLIGGPVGYSNFCKRLDPRCDTAQAVVCWMQMRQAYRDETLQSFRTGTAFPNFDVHGALSNLIVVVPPVPLAQVFVETFALGRRLNLMAQSRTLAAIRDTLLPKLISGELRVKDASRFVREPVPC